MEREFTRFESRIAHKCIDALSIRPRYLPVFIHYNVYRVHIIVPNAITENNNTFLIMMIKCAHVHPPLCIMLYYYNDVCTCELSYVEKIQRGYILSRTETIYTGLFHETITMLVRIHTEFISGNIVYAILHYYTLQ